MSLSARWAAVVIAVAVTMIAVAGGRPSTSAQTNPIVSVDAISDGNNTATAVGPINPCLSTTIGAVFDVDIVIQGVTNIAGFQADLLYNPSVLKVKTVNYSFLLTTTGFPVLNLGNSTPDADGDFLLAAAMFSLTTSLTGASGSGVLARVTLEAIGSGLSALDLTKVKLSDASGNPIPPSDANKFYTGPVNDGAIAVGSTCSPDSDGDGVPDASDNCPAWPNPTQALPPWPVPANDPDCDGFTNTEEGFVGTDPLGHCANTPAANDEADDRWPADFDDNQTVDILDIVQMTPPVFNTSPPNANYLVRKDLNSDGAIDILDIVRLTPPVFGKSCT